MAKSCVNRALTAAGGVLAACWLMLAAPTALAQVEKVTAVKDDNGWRIQVDGEDYFIKGMVWSYSPRGQNYTYNLFGQSDDQIRKILDYDFGLMQAAGINTIRSFTMIPPRWVEYIYREYGIRSVINPLMGRYGYNVGGKWIPFTDYSDPLTRETLKRDMADFVERYKNTPGVIMFAFGNESNYGLSWSSFEIENLPEGEQQTAKARYPLQPVGTKSSCAGKERRSRPPVHDRQRRPPVYRPDQGTRSRRLRISSAPTSTAVRASPSLWARRRGSPRSCRSCLLRVRQRRVQRSYDAGGSGITGIHPAGSMAGDVQQGLGQRRRG